MGVKDDVFNDRSPFEQWQAATLHGRTLLIEHRYAEPDREPVYFTGMPTVNLSGGADDYSLAGIAVNGKDYTAASWPSTWRWVQVRRLLKSAAAMAHLNAAAKAAKELFG
jgi:hypothetical protein